MDAVCKSSAARQKLADPGSDLALILSTVSCCLGILGSVDISLLPFTKSPIESPQWKVQSYQYGMVVQLVFSDIQFAVYYMYWILKDGLDL